MEITDKFKVYLDSSGVDIGVHKQALFDVSDELALRNSVVEFGLSELVEKLHNGHLVAFFKFEEDEQGLVLEVAVT